ncbi:odorant receptor 2a-like [Microplitis mediator]|uniref:odorant receptor 2a-like n=1 Tax=Microplitis mediator TaxID=375433 RepID=UPI002555EC49|nr:odorant receptor 2a-like [Microplitis mediator]
MGMLNIYWKFFMAVGLWRPIKWHGLKAHLYNCYTMFVMLMNYLFFMTGVMDINFRNIDFFGSIDIITLMLQSIENFAKIFCLVKKRNDLLNLNIYLHSEPFNLRNDDEILIQKKYDDINRIVNFVCLTLGLLSTLWYTGFNAFQMIMPTVLPYRSKMPFNYSEPKIFIITAASQCYTVVTIGIINTTFGILFPSMMLQICAKICILQYRFRMIITKLENNDYKSNDNLSVEKTNENSPKYLIAKWVESHIALLHLFKCANSLFAETVFIHYVINSFVMCTLTLLLSRSSFDISLIVNAFYFALKCVQQFGQCASAHQVTLEFEDLRHVIFSTNWYAIDVEVQKLLTIIMSKTIKDVIFVSGYFVDLSLDSFKSIMKLSYTIFNVIDQ